MRSGSTLLPAMKPVLPSWISDEPIGRGGVHDSPQRDGNTPTPGEVLSEAGLLLAIHLALAVAVTLTLQLCGIA